MLKNFLSTGSGKDYLLQLIKFKNVNKQMQHAATQLFRETFDGFLIPTSSLGGSNIEEEHVVGSVASC
jgi:hypothetical protein